MRVILNGFTSDCNKAVCLAGSKRGSLDYSIFVRTPTVLRFFSVVSTLQSAN